jgi:hypothetical protein
VEAATARHADDFPLRGKGSTQIRRVCRPEDVAIVDDMYNEECFSTYRSLSLISFESDSKLTHIEAQACRRQSCPRLLSQMVSRSLPMMPFLPLALSRWLVQIAIQSEVWNKHRPVGLSDAFERRTSRVQELARKESGGDEERRTTSKPMLKLD